MFNNRSLNIKNMQFNSRLKRTPQVRPNLPWNWPSGAPPGVTSLWPVFEPRASIEGAMFGSWGSSPVLGTAIRGGSTFLFGGAGSWNHEPPTTGIAATLFVLRRLFFIGRWQMRCRWKAHDPHHAKTAPPHKTCALRVLQHPLRPANQFPKSRIDHRASFGQRERRPW